MPMFSQSSERINILMADDIPSPLSTPDDDDEEEADLNFNFEARKTSGAELYTIKTMFNPHNNKNVKVEYTNKNRDSFTVKERNFAKKATQCDSLEDLSQKVGDSYLNYY